MTTNELENIYLWNPKERIVPVLFCLFFYIYFCYFSTFFLFFYDIIS